MSTRVAITGVGAISSLGNSADALFKNWAAGVSGIEQNDSRCREFDPVSSLSRTETRRTDRATQLMMAAAREAAAQAGWEGSLPYDASRIGCIMGTGIGGLSTFMAQHSSYLEHGRDRIAPRAIPMLMPNAGSAAVAMDHGVRGPVHGVVSACSASTHAIGCALRAIQCGDADAAITGGGEATMTDFALDAFDQLGAISPSGVSRPFDLRRDGFVMGEGAGALILERADSAEQRGAEILGYVLGYGATNDSSHITAPDPSAEHAADAIRRAVSDAGLKSGQIDYINAHGTATQLNDKAETAAIKLALGADAADVPTSSLKSSIGHLLGGSGAVEAVATVAALRSRVAPPTLNHEQAEPELDLNYVPSVAQPIQSDADLLHGLSNSFGFGGHNAVVCLAA